MTGNVRPSVDARSAPWNPHIVDRWTEVLRNRLVFDVATQLGALPVSRSFGCPACGGARRGSDDRRGAIGFVGTGLGWRCHRCDAGGTAVDLAAYILIGHVPSRGDAVGWRELRTVCETSALLAPFTSTYACPQRPPEASHLLRPPVAEVTQVWDLCTRVDAAAEVSQWLRSRGLDPSEVARLNLARALPIHGETPPWLPSCTAMRCRVVFPAWNAHGERRSLRFRAHGSLEGPKCMTPNGRTDPHTLLRRICDTRLPDRRFDPSRRTRRSRRMGSNANRDRRGRA
jgi:hypothetical protein